MHEDNCYHCACFKIFTFLSYHLIFKLFSENEVFIFWKITHWWNCWSSLFQLSFHDNLVWHHLLCYPLLNKDSLSIFQSSMNNMFLCFIAFKYVGSKLFPFLCEKNNNIYFVVIVFLSIFWCTFFGIYLRHFAHLVQMIKGLKAPFNLNNVRIMWLGMAGVHTGFRTITLVLYIGSLPNLATLIPLWKGKNSVYFGVVRWKVKVTVTINRIFDNRVVSTW